MKKILLSLLFCFCIINLQAAPCDGSIDCFANINFSVIPGCPAEITPGIILIEECPTETYTITVQDEFGNPISNPVPSIYFDQVLTIIIANSFGNSCFSELIVTDDNAPTGLLPCDKDIATSGRVFLSADSDCLAEATGELFLTEIKLSESYTVSLFEDENYTIPVLNPVPYAYFDQIIYAKIFNSSGNFSTSELVVEDKIGPIANYFTDPGTLSCQDDIASMNLAGSIDNCDDDVEIELIDITYICGSPGRDSAILTYEAVDDSGNTRVSMFKTEFVDFCAFIEFPEDITVECPEDIPTDPTIFASDLFICARDLVINFSDISILGECNVSRIFSVRDNISGIEFFHTQLITVDNTPPNFTANPDSEITFTELTENTYDPYLEVNDNCGIRETNIYVEYLEPDDCTRPEFMVRYYMYAIDNCGNEITETKDVLVIRDGTARVRVDGRKDCVEDFVVTAVTANLVPPVTYVWSSSDPTWTVAGGPDNTAIVTPTSGRTDISVVAIDALGCEITDSKRYTCNGRGIRTRSISTIEIGPNPFEDQLYIKNIYGHSEITIFDLQGRIVSHDNLQDINGIWQKDLADVPAGIYILKLKNDGEEKLSKIVKTM